MTHLCGVHYEGGLLDVGTDSQEGKEPNTTLERSLSVHETGNSIVKNKLNIAFWWWRWWLWDNDDGDDEDGVDAAVANDYEMTMVIMMMPTSPDWDGAWCNGHRHRLPIFPTHLLINISDLHFHFSLTMYILWYGLHTDSNFNLL